MSLSRFVRKCFVYKKSGSLYTFGMAPIDIVFAIVLLFFVVSASVNGFIKELFDKLAFFGGLAAAFLLSGKLEPFVRAAVKNRLFSKSISFLLIFAIVFLLIKIIQQLAGNIFSSDIFSSLDHALGFFFGIAEGVFIIVCVIIVAESLPILRRFPIFEGSIFYKFFSGLAHAFLRK